MKKLLYLSVMLLTFALANANVKQVENKLASMINQVAEKRSDESAAKLYAVLKECADDFWIGDFPVARNVRGREWLEVLKASKDRLISFLTSAGSEEDEKAVMKALNKLG